MADKDKLAAERAAFEAWSQRHYRNCEEYRLTDYQFGLDAWQARAALEAQAKPEAYTEGHCTEKRKPGGCQLHNLHCGYPKCDRKAAPAAPARLTQQQIVYGYCRSPHTQQFVAAFEAGVRFAEGYHGIGKGGAA